MAVPDTTPSARRLEDGVDILIGTPGSHHRLLQAARVRPARDADLVLDEADRMFDLGFIKDIRFLLRRCPTPQNRQGMLFSATCRTASSNSPTST